MSDAVWILPPKRTYARGSNMRITTDARPFLRWWWLAGPFDEDSIDFQLEWIAAQGFGGVEIAWIRPTWYRAAIPMDIDVEWLSPEWSRLTAYTKRRAHDCGMSCDFTFGSCWPFGGACLEPQHASKTFEGLSEQRLNHSWDPPKATGPPFVLDHLCRQSLRAYSAALMPAFKLALAGRTSALFCDSLELQVDRLWNPRCWDEFAEAFGYRLEPFTDVIESNDGIRYDYRKFISQIMCREFYEEFTTLCHEHGAVSRVQCHGSPTDLISSYAAVDIPESEVLLFEPHFSRIAASAASLSGKPLVSCETFTCIYGFVTARNLKPLVYKKREAIRDLKFLADATFANGVNRIVWHGMPFNGPEGCNEFYASVHVGMNAGFVDELPRFNDYLSTVCSELQKGQTVSKLAIYLPNEDYWLQGRIPEDRRIPGANYSWEMRDLVVPETLRPFNPLWVSSPFLRDAVVHDGLLVIGQHCFEALYIDVQWLDADSLDSIVRLAKSGCKIALCREPQQPGHIQSRRYSRRLRKLQSLPNVVASIEEANVTPLISGPVVPPYWMRRDKDTVILFCAHPKAAGVAYPLQYGQGETSPSKCEVRIQMDSLDANLTLVFDPDTSVLLRVSADGTATAIDLPSFG